MTTTMTAPPQHMDALRLANEIRLDRAVLKREIKCRHRQVVDVLLDPPDCAQTMKVVDLLMAAPRWGIARARRRLFMAGVSESKTLDGLTERQRAALAEALR